MLRAGGRPHLCWPPLCSGLASPLSLLQGRSVERGLSFYPPRAVRRRTAQTNTTKGLGLRPKFPPSMPRTRLTIANGGALLMTVRVMIGLKRTMATPTVTDYDKTKASKAGGRSTSNALAYAELVARPLCRAGPFFLPTPRRAAADRPN